MELQGIVSAYNLSMPKKKTSAFAVTISILWYTKLNNETLAN